MRRLFLLIRLFEKRNLFLSNKSARRPSRPMVEFRIKKESLTQFAALEYLRSHAHPEADRNCRHNAPSCDRVWPEQARFGRKFEQSPRGLHRHYLRSANLFGGRERFF